MNRLYRAAVLAVIALALTGCGGPDENEGGAGPDAAGDSGERYSELLEYQAALEILAEDTEADVLDIETGITYRVKRVVGGFNTLADIETMSLDDTEKLLETAGGEWNIKRRAVIVTIGDRKLAASIAPFEHSGSEDYPYGDIIDNRTGATGSGINLDSVRDNGMVGVVDIYFLHSLTPGINRVDERHQEMVLKAYAYEG